MRYVRSKTLQEMCFHVICENLDKFIYEKIPSIPQRHIDFFLRVYSNECFKEYTKLNTKTEECLLWFISPHNKNIFLSDLTGDIYRKLQSVGEVITSLNLSDALVSENMLNTAMSLIPNVSHINLRRTYSSNKTLLCIGRMCPKLITLNLEECDCVTNKGMSHLCNNNVLLKNLNILYTSVTRKGLKEILIRMPSLENLQFDNIANAIYALFANYHDLNIENNLQLNLTKLVYDKLESSKNPLSVILICTKYCPNVKELHLLFPVDQNVLKMCSKFVHLNKLQLSFVGNMQNIPFSDTLFSFLPLANNITKLVLCSHEISPVTLIESFKNLKELYLKNVSFTDFREEEIKQKLTNLDILNISNLNVRRATTNKFLVLLLSLSKNVTRLTLNYIQYFPAEYIDIIIKNMKSLSFVQFIYMGSKLPPSYLEILKIPSMLRMDVDVDMWSTPAYDAYKGNTLSWRIVCDFDSEDQSDDSHFFVHSN